MLREAQDNLEGKVPRVLVAPHAGYPFSGHTAATAFATLRGAAPEHVVILGRSHHFHFEGAAIWSKGAFETPLGAMPIDSAIASELSAWAGGVDVGQVHAPEHALEVELPFLQVVVGDVPIVPVLFGSGPDETHVRFGEHLASILGPEDVVVVSTDLSHFLHEKEANVLDQCSLDTLLNGDPQAFMDAVETGHCSMCGATAVVAGMACAHALHAENWRLLDYRTSAWATGDPSSVVGYGAVSMAA
jgi:hypothetical protein